MSSISFFQQDQNWQNSQQAWAQQLSNNNAFFSVMQSALSDQVTGLASVANGAALDRVNSQISSIVKANSGSSTSASSAQGTTSTPASSASAASKASANPAPPQSTAVNLLSASTAASLLSGEIPVGSLLSVLA